MSAASNTGKKRRTGSQWLLIWEGRDENAYNDQKILLQKAGIPFDAKGTNIQHPAGAGIGGGATRTRFGYAAPGTQFIDGISSEAFRFEIRIHSADYDRWRKLQSDDASVSPPTVPVDAAPSDEAQELTRQRSCQTPEKPDATRLNPPKQRERTRSTLWHEWQMKVGLFVLFGVLAIYGFVMLTGSFEMQEQLQRYEYVQSYGEAALPLMYAIPHLSRICGAVGLAAAILFLSARILLGKRRKPGMTLLLCGSAVEVCLLWLDRFTFFGSFPAMLISLALLIVNWVYYTNQPFLFDR